MPDDDRTRRYPFTRGLADGEPYELHLVTNPTVQRNLDLTPFGIRIKTTDFCAEHFEFCEADYEVAQLLELFRLAHAMSSPSWTRVMPRWMTVDLALMASGVL